MKRSIYVILIFGIWLITSCKVGEPQKASISENGDGLSDYTLSIHVRDAGGGMFDDIFDQIQRITGEFNLVHMEWSGVFGEPRKIRARLHSLPEKMINMITSKIYGIPNVIAVDIDKN